MTSIEFARKQNKEFKGSDESTREFIQLRYKLRHHFNGRKHICAKTYGQIVEELGLSDIITPTQARKKWSNLVQKYKDIKSGYSTATVDWPYFQILDTVVPLMRKESITMSPTSMIDKVETIVPSDSLSNPLSASLSCDKDPLSLDTSAHTTLKSSSVIAKCKIETAGDGEPPQKRQKGRRAAQRARERWWGAVEDDDIGSDSDGSAIRGDISSSRLTTKTSITDNLDPTEMEVQTFQMLKSCSDSLAEIQETLKMHAKHQQEIMEKLTQTVTQQGDMMKILLSTITSQNALSQLSADSSQQHIGLATDRSFGQQKHRSQSHPRPDNQLLTSQQNLINALSHDAQDCDTSLVDNSELSDNITGL